MGIFSRIKKGMGLGTITFEIVVPSSISGSAGRLEGDVVITAKSEQQVKDVEVKLQRTISWQERESVYNSTTERHEDQWVDKSQTARTIAANNIVNSGAMVMGAIIAAGLSALGVSVVQQLLLAAAMCLVSAWLAMLLCRAEGCGAGV